MNFSLIPRLLFVLFTPILVTSAFIEEVKAQDANLKANGKVAPQGSRENPLRFAIVPAKQASRAIDNSSGIAKCLERESKLYWDIVIPNNYMAVAEGIGSKKIDVAIGDSMTYFFSNINYKAIPILQVGHYGSRGYQSMLIAKRNSGINSLEKLKASGRKFTFSCSDRASISSCVVPLHEFSKRQLKPLKEFVAGSMDASIMSVLQGKVDIAGAFYSPPERDKQGKLIRKRDARSTVERAFPNVYRDTDIIWLSEELPNEPVIVRYDLPKETIETLKRSMPICFREHPGINDIDNLFPIVPQTIDSYNAFLKILESMGIKIAPKSSDIVSKP